MTMVEAGLRRGIFILFFLTLGIHLRRDLPTLVAPLKQKDPRVAIEAGQPLEVHPLLAFIILDRVQEVNGETQVARRT